MKFLNNKITYLIILIVSFLVILFVLFNSILYPYKEVLKVNLNNYYKTGEQTNIDNINKLINRYRNNDNRLNTVESLIKSNIDSWINEYNDNYEDIDSLDNKKEYVTNRITFLIGNLDNNITINKDIYLNEIENLYISKTNYLNAMVYLDDEDYSKAYDYFKQVIENDSFYSISMEQIDKCIESTLNRITNKVLELNVIDDNTNDNDKLKVYENIFTYLSEEKNNTNTDLINEYVTNLINQYVIIAKNYADETNYQEAVDLINHGIKLLSNGDYNIVSLTDLVSAYQLMLPISLTTLNSTKTGDWINAGTGIIDISNNVYVRGLEFYIGSSKSYNKNVITYNINGEYKYLKGTLVNARG